MEQKPFDADAFEHVIGSSMSPEILAALYGISVKMVHLIQMGKIKRFEEAEAMRKIEI